MVQKRAEKSITAVGSSSSRLGEDSLTLPQSSTKTTFLQNFPYFLVWKCLKIQIPDLKICGEARQIFFQLREMS